MTASAAALEPACGAGQLALPFIALAGGHAPPASPVPDPGETARWLIQATLEVLAGDRPARQLSAHTGERVLLDLEAAIGRRPGRPAAQSVRSVRVCRPATGVAEVSGVVAGLERGADGGEPEGRESRRCRAVALRLEERQGRWVMTALSIG